MTGLPENAAEKLNTVLENAQIGLSSEQTDRLLSYYSMLIDRNTVMNLTAITEFDEVIRKHFTDSLAPVSQPETKQLFTEKNVSMLDLGTGAGFPGLPLAIALPDARITLADSLQKRTRFLQEVVDELKLTNVRVINGRAEDLGKSTEHREKYDIVVSRAVADLCILCEYCVPFVKTGGVFAAWKGPGAYEEIKEAQNALQILNSSVIRTIPYILPDTEGERNIVIIKKEDSTPEKYPRRAGIPSKRPL